MINLQFSRLINTNRAFHGFSAKLFIVENSKLKSTFGVLSYIPKQVHHLHTMRSLEFLGLKTSNSVGLLKESSFGSVQVIGVFGYWDLA